MLGRPNHFGGGGGYLYVEYLKSAYKYLYSYSCKSLTTVSIALYSMFKCLYVINMYVHVFK